VGIRDTISHRRRLKEEKRAARDAREAKINEIAEWIGSSATIFAMASQGFAPDPPPGLTLRDMFPARPPTPKTVVDRGLELSGGQPEMVSVALVRAQEDLRKGPAPPKRSSEVGPSVI
jgi:hypothetical protein